MYTILLVIHVLICISLVISVLLQSSKGGGLGGAFGGTTETLFGGSGASSFLKKATKVLGVSFMVCSILLALSTTPQKTVKASKGVSEEVKKEMKETSQKEEPTPLSEGFEVLPKPEKTEHK
jgi:preprotein translocase subunit SecG